VNPLHLAGRPPNGHAPDARLELEPDDDPRPPRRRRDTLTALAAILGAWLLVLGVWKLIELIARAV